MRIEKSFVLLHPQIAKAVDSVAQQVEHNTFNVGVLGSSPSRVTRERPTKKSAYFFKSSTMRKLALTLMVLASIFASTVAFAQEPVKPYKVYCEIVSTTKIFSNKATVELDFGQFSGFWSADRQLVDEQGNTIDFNSALDAANYMARRGWDLEEVFIVQEMSDGSSSSPRYHWVLSKMVTDDSQITEGLRTRGMNK